MSGSRGRREAATIVLGATSVGILVVALCYYTVWLGYKGFCRLFTSILPAMVANGGALALTRLYARRLAPGSRLHPVDFGLRLSGSRLLGDGKTWEGLILGTLAGLVAGLVVLPFAEGLPAYYGGVVGFSALLGDIAGSFIKRRLGLARGQCAPLLDQLDFYIASLAAVWLLGYAPVTLVDSATIAAVIVALHTSTNMISWAAGLKEEWC